MKRVVKLACLALALITLMTIVFTGCAKKEVKAPDTAVQQKDSKASAPPAAFPMYVAIRGAEADFCAPSFDGLFKKKAKEKWNIDITTEYVDKNTYYEKLNVKIAAGTLPDLMYMGDDSKQIEEAIQNKVIIPVTDILNNDPVWSKVDKNFFKRWYSNGEYYCLTEQKNVPETMHYRVDWVKKLNLKVPSTVDEFYEMVYGFSKKDPDGNGKDDTYGLTMQGDLGMTSPLWQMFLPGNPLKSGSLFVDTKDNTIKSVFLYKDDMKKALAWFNKAYKEGVLDKQFITLKQLDVENKFVTGVVGTWVKVNTALQSRYEKMKTNFPDVDITTLPGIKGPYGSNYKLVEYTSSGYFLTKTCKDVERGKKLLSYFVGPEGLMDRVMGEEGKTYRMENGKIVWLDPEGLKRYNPSYIYQSSNNMKPLESIPIVERNMQNSTGVESLKDDVSLFANQSQMFMDKISDVNKTMLQGISKIIVGDMPVSSYDSLVDEITKMGLDKIIEDVNKVFKAKK